MNIFVLRMTPKRSQDYPITSSLLLYQVAGKRYDAVISTIVRFNKAAAYDNIIHSEHE